MLSLPQSWILEDGRIGIGWWVIADRWEALIPRLLEWIVAWVCTELGGSR
jgi:hypothetical protein